MYESVRLEKYGKVRDYYVVPCDTCGREFPKRKSFVDPAKHNFCSRKCRDGYSEEIHKSLVPGEKICRKCKQSKPFDQFYKRKRSKDGLTANCRECTLARYRQPSYKKRMDAYREENKEHLDQKAREARYLRKYGLTWDDFEQMKEQQGNVCAICREPFVETARNGTPKFCVDHDHETGKVRGLLCDLCNNGLGRFRDQIPLLEKAIEYLRAHSD